MATANNVSSEPITTMLTHSAPLWNLPAHRARCLEAMLYLEMADIKYKRKFVKYNINYFYSELELPLMRHNIQTTRNVIDFCEGIGNEKSLVMGTNNTLNSHLESPQQADVSALQSLIRDRLHLVFVTSSEISFIFPSLSHYICFYAAASIICK